MVKSPYLEYSINSNKKGVSFFATFNIETKKKKIRYKLSATKDTEKN